MATSNRPKRSGLIMWDEEYDDHTKVYTASEVGRELPDLFHADYHCHHLSNSNISVLSLREVLADPDPPLYPCQYCTLDIQKTIEVAVDRDDLHPDDVHPVMRPENTGDERPRRQSRS